jgi:Tfp pilus assembly protein PilF
MSDDLFDRLNSVLHQPSIAASGHARPPFPVLQESTAARAERLKEARKLLASLRAYLDGEGRPASRRSQKLELALVRRHILRLRQADLFTDRADLAALEEADGAYRRVASRLFPRRDPYEEFAEWCERLQARAQQTEEFFRTRTTVLRQITEGRTYDWPRLEAHQRTLANVSREWNELIAQSQADLLILNTQKGGTWDELREFGAVSGYPDWEEERIFHRTRAAVELAAQRGELHEDFTGLLRSTTEKIAAARQAHAAQVALRGRVSGLAARRELGQALELALQVDERFTDTGLPEWHRRLAEAAASPARLGEMLAQLQDRFPARYPWHFRLGRTAAARALLPGLQRETEQLRQDIARALADELLPEAGRLQLLRLHTEAQDLADRAGRLVRRSAAGFRLVLVETGALVLVAAALAVTLATRGMQRAVAAESPQRTTGHEAEAFAAYRRAQEDLARKDFAAADRELTQAIRQKADYAKAMVLLAETKNREGEPALAASFGTRAILNDPADAGARLARAEARRVLGETEGALADYAQAIYLDPGCADAAVYNHLGELRIAQYDPAGAQEAFTQAIARAPSDPLGHLNRGRVRLAQHDLAGAEEDFTRALSLAPADPAASFLRAEARYQRSDFAGARRDYDAAVERGTKDPEVYYRRGRLHAEQGRGDAAILDFDCAILLQPDHVGAWYARGEAKAKRSHYEGGDDGTADRLKAQELERLAERKVTKDPGHNWR